MSEYVERVYRLLHRQDDLVFFQLLVKETDLDIGVPRRSLNRELVEGARQEVIAARTQLEQYILRDAEFLKTLAPHRTQPGAPAIAVNMALAGQTAGTGPMAAVAGAVAQQVGAYLARRTREVIVENGGDIFMRTERVRRIGIFAGPSPFTNRLALEIEPYHTPLGICTSSGTVGPSFSMGCADAMVVLAPSAALADAVASAAGNLVQSVSNLQQAVDFALGIKSVTGALAIKDDQLAAAGNIKLAPM